MNMEIASIDLGHDPIRDGKTARAPTDKNIRTKLGDRQISEAEDIGDART